MQSVPNITISGKQLRQGTALERVLAAYGVCNGGALVSGLSCMQAERLTRVRRHLISIVNRATPETIEALSKGEISLTDLRAAAEETKPSDAAVRRYIARVGLGRIVDLAGRDAAFALFDSMTAPIAPAVE